MNIPVVIPAYEPDERLFALCDALSAADMTAVLVDDGSGARFRDLFDRIGAAHAFPVLRHERNLGKGRALKDAFAWILKERPEAVGCVTADSDGQHTAGDIRRVAEALLKEPDKLILGSRNFDLAGIPWGSVFGNKVTRVVMRRLAGLSLHDTQTGLRGIPADYMRECLSIEGERFEFETSMLLCTRGRMEIREIPIETVYDSATDHRTHFRPIRDSARIYRCFLRRRT